MLIKGGRGGRWGLWVCGGVARSQGWSPGLTRLATAVIAVAIPRPSTLLAFVIYLLLSFILPESEEY